ncbi:MAG TPA: HAMP domain-containing sensor histidine kinase [Puia sp.]|nr:HAMP domain-containing sensor histidine kinase [Puia sp.]
MKHLTTKLRAIIYLHSHDLPEDDMQKKVAVGVNLMSFWVILLTITVGTLFYFISHNILILAGITIETILLIGAILLNHIRRYHIASLSIYLTMSTATLYYSSILGRPVEAQLMVVYLIGVALFMFPDLATRILCIAVTVSLLVLLELNFKYQVIQSIKVDETTALFMRWSSYAVIITLVIFTFVLYSRNNKLLLDRLRRQAEEVQFHLEKEEKANEKKDIFISNAYHEIRASFFSIFSILNLFNKEKTEDLKIKDWRRAVTHLRTACQISQNIMDNILEYEKYEIGTRNAVYNDLIDIRSLIDNIVEIYQYSADERKVKITARVSEDMEEYILCDKVKLNQVITNLLTNAVKYTRSETDITIRVTRGSDQWQLSVEDQGEGIKEPNINSIFEPFVTGSPTGIGLGLYITKKTVNLMKGKISVDSRPDQGTRFTISMPLRPIHPN